MELRGQEPKKGIEISEVVERRKEVVHGLQKLMKTGLLKACKKERSHNLRQLLDGHKPLIRSIYNLGDYFKTFCSGRSLTFAFAVTLDPAIPRAAAACC